MVPDSKDWLHSSYNTYGYGAKNDMISLSITYEEIIDKELVGA